MKKSAVVFLLFSFLLTSCGAKKNVATNVESTPGETEANEVVTSADTLPEFLREFANDSTIHINWAYGIPFVIDDSVPMFLPPIDKTPEGYISSVDYRKHMRNLKHALSYWGETLPLDTVPWLNKMMCELESFSKSLPKGFQYIYHVNFFQKEESPSIIEVKLRAVRTDAAYDDGKTMHYRYHFSVDGCLLGKCNGTLENKKIDTLFAKEKRMVFNYIIYSEEYEFMMQMLNGGNVVY